MENLNLYFIVGSAMVVIVTIIWAIVKTKGDGLRGSRIGRKVSGRKNNGYKKSGRESRPELDRRERDLRKREKEFTERERMIRDQEQKLAEREIELRNMLESENKKLSKVSGMNRQQAKEKLVANIEKQCSAEMKDLREKIKENAIKSASEEAAEIVEESVRKHSEDNNRDLVFSVFMLPRTEIKSWVIGSSGRNIRTFESSTGAKLVISQFSDAVVISARDASRVKMAEVALDELITFGKITPELILDKVAHLKDEYVEFFEED